MKEIYLVIYTHPYSSHSFVKSAHVEKIRAEAQIRNANQDSSYEQIPGDAYSIGYFAHIQIVKLEDFGIKE